MKRVSLITLLLILSTPIIIAQNFDLGSWNIVNLKLNVNNKWSLFGESQLRSLKFYTNFHYYEYKAGFNYKFHSNATFTLGAGSYQTYREGGDFVTPKNNNEFRIWPQIVLFQSLGKLKIEQRYRTELRFTSNGYRNRFRYRLGLSYPFGKEKNDYKPFKVSTSNEIFFTDNEQICSVPEGYTFSATFYAENEKVYVDGHRRDGMELGENASGGKYEFNGSGINGQSRFNGRCKQSSG